MKLTLTVFILLVINYLSVLDASPLDDYIQMALNQNLALQQKEFSMQRSVAALKEARGMFLPSIGIDARYSRAGGGREISIPVGDLMNPVYATLNQLLSQSGQPALFPENIPNVSEPFLREKEHETKLRLIQPIFQPAILYNYRIKQNLKESEEAAKAVYMRHLIADVKTAYYHYLETEQIVSLLDATEALLLENLRVSQSLFENDKVNKAVVFRAEAELHAFRQQQAEAEKSKSLAKSYFNFLLNRPLETAIILTDTTVMPMQFIINFDEAKHKALIQREELQQLKAAIQIMKNRVNLSRSKFLPEIAAVVDYGYQGETYSFGKNDDYWMANFVASWNLFKGFQDKYKIDQALIEKKQMQSQFSEVEKQIQLQVQESLYNVNVSIKNIEAANAQSKAAMKSFQIMEQMFKEGMASQIEFIDARQVRTKAEVNAIVALFEYYISLAELEKMTADYPIDQH